MEQRIKHEIEHGKKISNNAENIWNWSSPAGQVRANRRAEYFINLGQIKKDDHVLEIGCGTGLFTGKVYEKTKANICAIDISNELLLQAKEKNPCVKFLVEDVMNMSFDNGSFDVVYGSSILHHLDINRSLEEILRVLKPNGRLILAEPNMINPQIFIQKNIPFIKKYLGDSPDETAIIRWQLNRMMEDKSFKSINIFPYDFLHPVTPRFLIDIVSLIGINLEKIPFLKEIAGSVIIYAEKK